MKPYFEHDGIAIYHGDCREVLPPIAPVETCLTDPPYGLSFMGKEWDHGVPGEEFWRVISAALLPGAICLAFGGTRTFHRLTCTIEDAGFEIRDCLMWLYGTGFPKSLDVSKAIDKAAGAEREVVGPNLNTQGRTNNMTGGRLIGGHLKDKGSVDFITAPTTDAAKQWEGWGTALKPAWEPIILAMKSLDGTFAQNALEHGVAGLNIDGSLVGVESRINGPSSPTNASRKSRVAAGYRHDEGVGPGSSGGLVTGRWPANVILDEETGALLDAQSGITKSSGGSGEASQKTALAGHIYGTYSGDTLGQNAGGLGDSSGASRFFYCAKASKKERGEGNNHPTVKPQALMEYLCKLTSVPTGGTVLDPFMGSGSTLLAAHSVGRSAIGIDLEEKYCEIAAKRLTKQALGDLW